jgi:predicted ATPase
MIARIGARHDEEGVALRDANGGAAHGAGRLVYAAAEIDDARGLGMQWRRQGDEPEQQRNPQTEP